MNKNNILHIVIINALILFGSLIILSCENPTSIPIIDVDSNVLENDLTFRMNQPVFIDRQNICIMIKWFNVDERDGNNIHVQIQTEYGIQERNITRHTSFGLYFGKEGRKFFNILNINPKEKFFTVIHNDPKE